MSKPSTVRGRLLIRNVSVLLLHGDWPKVLFLSLWRAFWTPKVKSHWTLSQTEPVGAFITLWIFLKLAQTLGSRTLDISFSIFLVFSAVKWWCWTSWSIFSVSKTWDSLSPYRGMRHEPVLGLRLVILPSSITNTWLYSSVVIRVRATGFLYIYLTNCIFTEGFSCAAEET